MDDVNYHNSDWSEQLEHLELVFERLRFANIKLNLGKCCFEAQEIVFLGHVVNEWIKTKPNKNVCCFQLSNSFIHHKCVGFSRFPRYYKTFIQGYAKIASPLFDITMKDFLL